MQMYSRLAEERVHELQQHHAKCASGLRRQAAMAEPYTHVSPPPPPPTPPQAIYSNQQCLHRSTLVTVTIVFMS